MSNLLSYDSISPDLVWASSTWKENNKYLIRGLMRGKKLRRSWRLSWSYHRECPHAFGNQFELWNRNSLGATTYLQNPSHPCYISLHPHPPPPAHTHPRDTERWCGCVVEHYNSAHSRSGWTAERPLEFKCSQWRQKCSRLLSLAVKLSSRFFFVFFYPELISMMVCACEDFQTLLEKPFLY